MMTLYKACKRLREEIWNTDNERQDKDIGK
jgi:hypothetical protein